jgi:hypothetical protein
MDADAIIVIGLKLLLVLFLVLLNGFFVAAEFAIVKVRDTQLVSLVAAGGPLNGVSRGRVGAWGGGASLSSLHCCSPS